MAFPVSAQARSAVQLNAVAKKKKPASLVTFAGRAGTRKGGKVTIQRKVGRRWRSIAQGRTGAKGRFALTWITPTPSRATGVTVRAKLAGRLSKTRRFRVLAPKKGATKVIVSPKTRIISPSMVQSIPTAGKPGDLTYAGGNDVRVGHIIVIGKGKETPDGFLGRVTDVEREDGETVVATVPATLLQAVPEGSMHLVASKVSGRPARVRAAARVTCEGSVSAAITHEVTFGAGISFDGSWTLLGGPQSASVTASASLNASLKAAITAAGSCSLARITVLSVKGPTVTGSVGPVPIVLTSNLSVYLDAAAQAQAELSTGASAGFDASAGVGWTKANGFYGIQSFSPHFSFDPPSISANASVGVNVTPTVSVLLYGLAGPQITLRTGLEFTADPALDPWWTLAVPVDVTASIAIPPLAITSPELHVYQRSFTITDAGGPFGAPPPPPPGPANNGATPSSSQTAGWTHTCALRSSGAVACWGSDASGQLGNGPGGNSNVPAAVTGIADATAVAAGTEHTCALRVQGQVACWGNDGDGRLGNGAAGSSQTPVAVSNMTSATAVAAGSLHTCVLQTNRHVSCWGANGEHQLGDGGTTPSDVPFEVSGIANATSIASGFFHSCAVRAGGTVACWGRNAQGQLGNGSSAPSAVPVAVSGLTDATEVVTGISHTCALRATGEVVCWGADNEGQLGNGLSDTSTSVPTPVSGITNATGLDAGLTSTCARLATGEVTCWGGNEYGQLGDGSDHNARPTPVLVSGITDATAVTAGWQHACARRTSGALACWGAGVNGELGNGANPTLSNTPVAVTGFP